MNYKRPSKGRDLIDVEVVVAKPAPPAVSKFVDDDNVQKNYGNAILFLTPLERKIAVNVAEGMRYPTIAKLFDMQTNEVKLIANRKHVRKFINDFVKDTTVALKASRIATLSQIIEAKLDKVHDMADASEMDVAALMVMLDNMQKEAEKAELQKGNQTTMLNVLSQLRKD